MKRFFYLLLLMSFWGCSKNNDENNLDPSTNICLELSQTELIFEAEGEIQNFRISAYTADKYESVEWMIVNECAWCRTDIIHGYGEQTVSVTVNAYTETEDRNVNLLIKAGEQTKVLTITQKHINAIILSKDKFEVSQEGGNIEVEVKSNIDYEVIIPTQFQQWIKEIPESKAMTTRNFNFEIFENETYEKREGYIVFQGNKLKDTVHIYQVATEKSPEDSPNDEPSGDLPESVLILSKSSYDIPAAGETIEVELKTNIVYDIIISKSASEWIENAQTKTNRVDKIYLNVKKNETYEERDDEIIIKDKYSELNEILHIHQQMESVLILSRSDYKIPAKGKQISIDVKSNIEYDVIIEENAHLWIQQMPQSKNLSIKTLNFNISENTTEYTRTTDILIKSKNGQLTQTLHIDQWSPKDIIVHKGDVRIMKPDDMTNFINAGYTKIEGNLYICPVFAAEYMDSFEGFLKEITGDFTIQNKSLSNSFKGLNNLEKIGGTLFLFNVNNIKSFEGLENLKEIGGNFRIWDADFLTFKGLNNLINIRGDFTILGPRPFTSLTSFDGLNNLEKIGGDFHIFIFGENNLIPLISFNGLNNLKEIGGNFSIDGEFNGKNNFTSLTSFSGLNNLKRIGGDFVFDGINSLTSLDGLNSLEKVGGGLSLHDLDSLKSLDDLKNLQEIGGKITIDYCPKLFDFCILKNIVISNQNLFYSHENGYNPTREQILNGECSKSSIE